MTTGTRAAGAALVVASVFGFGGLGVRAAHADPKGDINTKVKEAMESYDLMDYEAAKKSLNAAVAVAKKNKLDKDPVAARVWLDLGIVAFAVPDAEGAKKDFQQAVDIDAKIQIDAAYRSAEMAKLLDETRKHAKKPSGGTPPPDGGGGDVIDAGDGGSGADCASVKGLQHNIIDTSRANAPAQVEAEVGTDLSPAKVSLQYRPEGATSFTEVKMTKSGCKYSAAIPASATHGSIVHYYVAAYDAGNKVIAAKGSAGSPNIMELSGGGTVHGDEEDPLAGKHGGGGGDVAVKTGGSDGDTSVTGTVSVDDHKPKKVWLTIAAGTGGGYITGTTELNNKVNSSGVGPTLAVFTPELSLAVTPKVSIGLAARIGLPVGANITGHSTLAPAGLLRVHYAMSETGNGLHVMGQAGAGLLRETIKLDAMTVQSQMLDGNTDIVAQGPLLLGAGLGYGKHLSNGIVFTLDLSVLAGIAVVSTVGTSTVNNGVSADLSLGLAFGL